MPEALTKDRMRNNQLTSFGWHVLRFSGREIRKSIDHCLEITERTISSLKGLVKGRRGKELDRAG